jgi:long-chain acyl-CoA synthetase
MRDMIRRAEKFYPGKTAVVCGAERWTYRESGTRIRKLAGVLSALGITRGDRVAVLMLNCHRYLELYAACFELGAIIVPLNIRLAPPEVIYTVNDAEAALLFVDETFLPLVEGIRDELRSVREYIYAGQSQEGTRVLPAGMHGYELLLDEADELRQPPVVREEDVAGLFYTSGTTGYPKGVMLTNRNLCANALQGFALRMPPPETVFLHSTPMFHLAGGPTAWIYFWIGATHVVQPRFEPKSTFELIERERISRVTWVPTMITMLLAHPDVVKVDFSSLRMILYGASPIAPDRLKEALRVFGCELMQVYGMTEVAPILTALPPEDHQPEGDERKARRLLSCGREVPGVTVRVVNARGEDVAPGEVGEIIARGANIMLGYWRKPEETTAVLRDGWYYSGDMGAVDEDGYIYMVDRKKDMIISGGENIYSVEVENALSNHPAVLECAAIGVPDERWGEVVKALVVFRPGMHATEDDLIVHCKTQIAGYKCPQSVDVLDVLPKSASGKVLKRELREPYWQGYTRRVN